MQNHLNLLYREEEREMLGLCAEEGIGVIPWSPLARGRLAREYTEDPPTKRAETDQFGKTLYKEQPEAERAIIDAVGQVAASRGVPRAQVALAWVLTKPAVSAPIIGASKMQHLDDAIAALSITLTADEIRALEAPYRPRAVAGFA
jgi:aryl-alcohol dehydrogenase-like predicted oxidoreductase